MEDKNRFSYSKLDTYDQCKFKYYLSYDQGIKIPATSIALDFGTLVHETEECIAKAIAAGETINYTKLKNDFILRMAEIQAKYPDDYFTADKSGKNYHEKKFYYLENTIYNLEKLMQEHPTYQIIGIEKEFGFDYDSNHFMHGFIDRVFYDVASGNYIIQDIKTYAVPMEQSKLTTPLQFVFYA